MPQYLDKTGLTTLWTKIKNTFALKSHTHTKSQIKDFPTIPTVNNPTITINQGGTKKGSFTLNQSGATTIDLTDNNTNTWRPVVDNLTSTATDQSLSANQGKVLKDLVDGKQPKGNYVTTDTAQTISGLKTFKGNESNNISFVYNGNSTISGHGRYTAIRHALSFPWYNDVYQIGNIRGDSADSLGFGITKSNNTIVARFVDTSNAYIGNNTIIHSGNIGSQNVNYANSAGSVAWGNVSGKPSSFTPASHTHSSVTDIGNSTATTFAYSKAGMNYGDYTWLAGWNGYELRAVNKSQFATASHTHSYLPLSGGTLTGSLTFKNSTWNLVGDDVYIGDYDQAGSLGIKGANSQTNIGFVNQSNNYYIKLASPGVTENRTITMPNDSGTMALTKNIPTSLPASNISMSSDGTTLTITYS